MRQILLNLLSNAVKFTDEGGVTLRLRVDADDIWFSVVDTGVGMEAEDVARIGERFLDPAAGRRDPATGTGLGLALARGLAELHGGELRFESQPGRGTAATLRLPLVGIEGGADGTGDDDSVQARIARVRAFGDQVSGHRGAA